MRKFISLCAIALTALCACNKQSPVSVVPSDGRSTLSIAINDGPATKAIENDTNELLIQNVQVYIFKGGNGPDAGILDISWSAGFSTPLGQSGTYTTEPITCAVGDKEIYVVLNDVRDRTKIINPDESNPEITPIRIKQQLLDQTSHLKDNAANKLLMIGHLTKTLTEGTQTANVEVRRVCAAIVLQSVKNAFDSPAYQAADNFRLTDVFLLNVPSKQNFNMESQLNPADINAYSAEDWYSKLAPENDSLISSLIYDKVRPDSESVDYRTVNYGESYTVPHTFYSYPNSCALSEELAWSDAGRATVLVVKAQVKVGDGMWKDSYYPVIITEGLKSNYKYNVNIEIHRPGSDDPNKKVKFADLTTTIDIVPWGTGEPYNETI